MLPGPKHRKAIAATCFLVFFTQIFFPAISYALTSGPTQPEANSFEPADTTDMVNLITGDLAYNMPLLEVPSPEGGYPLSLSYAAGIQPNMDASWVGLGWTLNPGAINRSVNGFPDDWNSLIGSSHVYWSGGQTDVFNAGVNIGIAQTPFSVNFGLSIAKDTYKGFSVGYDVSLGIRGPGGSGVNTSIGLSAAPFTHSITATYNTSQEVGIGPLKFSQGIGMSTNFQTIQGNFYGSLGYGSSLGASLSSAQSGFSYMTEGFARTHFSSKDAGVETSTKGFTLPTIPVAPLVNVSLGFTKTRYWTDENTSQYLSGSLYPNMILGQFVPDNYSLLEDPSVKNIVAYPDPTPLQGGTYPAFDDYEVLAQGLQGVMSPIGLEEALLGQNHKDKNGNPTVTDDFPPGGYVSYSPTFRFQNDFSNSHRQAYNQYPDITQDVHTTTPPFSTPVFGNNDGTTGAQMWSPSDPHPQKLEGSRHIDIGVQIKPTNCLGYASGDRLKSGMIEGFAITNESGFTYHFCLPAYSYNEQNYQEKIDRSTGLYFNRDTRNAPYAYTWYLTTITGPDFVDRDGNGKAGPNDWGYWVNFEYGKWDNEYVWRNPSEGYLKDEDNKFKDCAQGYREVYYLNAVQTRSHVAIFEKNIRNDAKGSTPAIFNTNPGGPLNKGLDYTNSGSFDVNSGQSLQLSHIYLLNIADSNLVNPATSPSGSYTPAFRTLPCSDCELPQNIIDYNDVAPVRPDLETRAIRVIDFNYDYSLCQGTSNSLDILGGTGPYGKLTLKSLVMRGKGGANLMPPTTFQYDLSGTDIVTQTGVTISSNTFTTSNGNFNQGDMIQTTDVTPVYCGVITIKSPPSGGVYTYTLANGNYAGGTTNIQTTKNPPYNKDLYDSWGMYKSDGDLTLINSPTGNENMARYTSPVSAKGTDAWCLRTIGTPLGDNVKIKYESDAYHTSVMNNTYSYVMNNPQIVSGTNLKQITFNLATYGSTTDPNTLLTPGQYCPNLIIAASYINANDFCSGDIRWTLQHAVIGGLTINSAVTISGVTTFTGTLDNPIPSTAFGGSLYGLSTGNLWISSSGDYYGGGVRVASVTSLNSLDGSSSGLLYNYNNPTTGASSGVTSYSPNTLDAYDDVALNAPAGPGNYCQLSYDVYWYKSTLYQNTSSIYPLAQELPPPGIMYQYVTVSSQVQNPDESSPRSIEGSTTYQFEVFNANMVNRKQVNPVQQYASQYAANLVIRKFTAALGQLKSITQRDNNGAILNQTINHFLHDDLENANLSADDFYSQYQTLIGTFANYQGLIQERYLEIKDVSSYYTSSTIPTFLGGSGTPLMGTKATLSARETYPCIPTGQTVINYINGMRTSTTNLAFDYYSGQVIQQVQSDAYGNTFLSKTTPAYYKYPAMGLKINNPNNKSMLSQAAETYMYKVDGNNVNQSLAAASVTTWSDAVPLIDINGVSYTQNDPGGPAGDVWRKQSTYEWQPTIKSTDGLTPLASFSDFNWGNPSSSDPGWKNVNNVVLYDVFSKDLDNSDINGNHGAVRLDYGDQRVVMSGNPANFYEIAFSGAEDAGISQSSNVFVHAGQGSVSSAAAHTGGYSLLLNTSGTKGFTYSVPTGNLTQNRNYLASVWVKPISGTASTVVLQYDINGAVKNTSMSSGSSNAKTANGWYLISLPINGSDITPGNTLNVYCINNDASIQAYVDDFRFQPLNGSSTAYVYDPNNGELDYVLDNSNVYTKYVYDGMGKLSSIFKEKLGTGVFKLNDYVYNYSPAKFLSDPLNNAIYTRNDCSPGYLGTNVTINFPQGTYISYLSQADADYLSYLGAQAQANQQGVCQASSTIPVTISSGMLTSISFNQGSTTVVAHTFSNTGGSMLVPNGTYTVIVSQTNSVSHTVNMPPYGSQTGVSVTFTNVVVPNLTAIQVTN